MPYKVDIQYCNSTLYSRQYNNWFFSFCFNKNTSSFPYSFRQISLCLLFLTLLSKPFTAQTRVITATVGGMVQYSYGDDF